MKKIALIFFLLLVNNVFACLNETRILLNGEVISADEEMFIPYGRDFLKNKSEYEKELILLEQKWKKDKHIEDYSDYGVVLVYLGKFKEALKVFQKIESIKPGLYTTAANLGTTYELLGDNELAFRWTEKAVSINPASHDSSEWLHLNILQIKIQGNKLLNSNYLIGTNFGYSKIPKSNLSQSQLIALKSAIYYQLNERVSFIKPKDKIVALLLFELGNICAITDDATSAFEIYKMAKDYGYSSSVFKKRFEFVKKLQLKIIEDVEPKSININPIQKNKSSNTESDYSILYYVLAFFCLLLIGFIIWKKIKKRKL